MGYKIIPFAEKEVDMDDASTIFCCTTDYKQNETLVHGTLKLYLDTSWNKIENKPNNGFIESVSPNYEGVLKVGHKIYGNHFLMNHRMPNLGDDIKHSYVKLSEIYAYIEDDEIKLMPDKFFVEYVDEQQKSKFLLPEYKKMLPKQAIVTKIPDGEEIIKVGDRILYHENADYDMKIEGKEYICIWFRNAILGKIIYYEK